MSTPESSGLATWVDRGVGLFCLGTLIPAAVMAADQLHHLAPLWVVVVGGGIVATSVAMVVWSFLGRPLRALLGTYVALVAGGLITWPLAWESAQPASGSPWLWMCMGVSTICLALIAGTRWGLLYAIASGMTFAIVRMTSSGQGIPLLNAAQDMLILFANPTAVMVGLAMVTDSVARLDASLARTQREEAEAAVEEALVQERRRLDGIVHDEVMTTLVAAAQSSGPHDQRVVELARRAIERLNEAEQPADSGVPVTSHHLAWLVEDVVVAVCPGAEISSTLTDPVVTIPPAVASALGQAVREVALNVSRHARADQVEVVVSDPDAGRPGIQITVSDNGRGFDLGAVPPHRFGLQVSVADRLDAVGARADVRSQPGRGTKVVLTWLEPPKAPARVSAPTDRAAAPYPELPAIRGRVLLGLVWFLVATHFVLGWTSLDEVLLVWPVLLANALAVVATAVSLRRPAVNPMGRVEAWIVVGLIMAVSQIVSGNLPVGHWPGYATWHSSVVMVLLIVLLMRGREGVAWTGVALFSLSSVAWAYGHGLGLGEAIRVAFGPISWMMVATMLRRWLAAIGVRLEASRQSSRVAHRAMAASFSKLVLRDIWLGQLRAQVGPLLSRLADPQAELTQGERDACLAAESRLREGLRAGNLLAAGLSDAIEAARRRGVEVVLVDSRGSTLPESVQPAVRRQLERLLARPGIRKVVVRAAPEGYAEVVTILTVRADGGSELTTLDQAGAVSAS